LECIIFNSGFFIRNEILIFFFWIFISRTQKSLPDLFFQNILFSISNFYFRNKRYFQNFWNYVGCKFKSVGCRSICQKLIMRYEGVFFHYMMGVSSYTLTFCFLHPSKIWIDKINSKEVLRNQAQRFLLLYCHYLEQVSILSD